jgi:hypothetical protein
MALVVFDRVQETTATTGTGTITLAGAVAGYQSFAVVGNGNTTFYCITNGSQWEVGIGTYTSSGTTLARTTVLSNSDGNTSPITLVGASNVFVTYPSEKSVNLDASGNVSPLGTITSGVWNGTTIPVAYGGTGVTASSGANSVVLRDANQNVVFNNFIAGFTAVTAAAGTTVLTVASTRTQVLVGSTTQTIQMPNATTLQVGHSFIFVNNSSDVLTITDNASATIDIIPSGGATQIGATSVATSAGSWGIYSFLPGSYNFSGPTADFGTATITNATYQGNTIASGYGGTGLTTFTAANNALYSTGASTLTAGTLPFAAGGTGATSAPYAMANLMGFTTTVTSATPVVLTNASSFYQLFTGSTAQVVTLPVTSTLQQGWTFHICNNNTSNSLTVQTSGGNSLITVLNGTTAMVTCIATGGTGTADWEAGLTDFSSSTGGGAVVLNVSPTLTGAMNLTGSTTSNSNFGSAVTSGTISIGGTSGTGTITVGQSTVSQTTNIQAGATASGSTKTMNIGTGGLSGSTTAINIGSANGTTTTFSGTVNLPSTSAVTSFSAGTTGFTPSSATTGAVTLAGTLNVANGGTGLTTLTAGYIPFGSGTSAFGNSVNLFWDSANARLGIGTSSPAQKLDVQAGTCISKFTSTTGTNAVYTQMVNTGGNFYIGTDSSAGGTTSTAYARFIYGDGLYPMTFWTNSAERMRLDSGGALLVGATAVLGGEKGNFTQTSTGAVLRVINTNASFADTALAISTTRAASTAFNFINASANSVSQFTVRGDGAVTAASLTTVRYLNFSSGGTGGYIDSADTTWGLVYRPSVAGSSAMHLWTNTTGGGLMNLTAAGVLNATQFSGSGSGLTGTASSLSIGGNAATASNVAGLVANTYSSYTNIASTTAKSGWYGMLAGTSTGLHFMATNAGTGGFYNQGQAVWPFYYEAGVGSAIGGSTTYASYGLTVTGYARSTGLYFTPSAVYGAIFYDSDDSSYYCDPNVTSRMYHIQNVSPGISYPGYAAYASVGSNQIGFGWSSPYVSVGVDNAISGNFVALSDRRLKTDIVNFGEATDLLNQIRIVEYTPLDFDGTPSEKRHTGVIADELIDIIPEAVVGETNATNADGKPRYQSVTYAALTPFLTKGFQEHDLIIKAQQAQIEQMQTQIDALIAKVGL